MSAHLLSDPKESPLVVACEKIVSTSGGDKRRVLNAIIKRIETEKPEAPVCMEAAYALADALTPKKVDDFFFASDVLIKAIDALLKIGVHKFKPSGGRWGTLTNRLINIENGRKGTLGNDNAIVAKPTGALLDYLSEKGLVQYKVTPQATTEAVTSPSDPTASPEQQSAATAHFTSQNPTTAAEVAAINGRAELLRYCNEVRTLCERGKFRAEGDTIGAYLSRIRQYVSRNQGDIRVDTIAHMLSIMLSEKLLNEPKPHRVLRDVLSTFAVLLKRGNSSLESNLPLVSEMVGGQRFHEINLQQVITQDCIANNPDLVPLAQKIGLLWHELKTTALSSPHVSIIVQANITIRATAPLEGGPKARVVSPLYGHRNVGENAKRPLKHRRHHTKGARGPKR